LPSIQSFKLKIIKMETVKAINPVERSQALTNQSIQNHLKTKEISFLENQLTLAKQERESIQRQSIRLYHYHLIVDDIQVIISKAYPEAYKKLSETGILNQFYQKEYETFASFKSDIEELFYRIFFSEGKDKIYDFKDLSFCNQKHKTKLAQQDILISGAWISQLVACLDSKSLSKNITLQQVTSEWLFSKTLRLFIALSELTRNDLIEKAKAKVKEVKSPVRQSHATVEAVVNQTTPIVKPYTKKELTNLYGISKAVLRRWLKQHDDILGKSTKLFNLKQVEFIFKQYGYPKILLVKLN
jgi:hypothetical protein